MYLAQVLLLSRQAEVHRVSELLAERPSLRLTICPTGNVELPASLRERVEICATATPGAILPLLRGSDIRRLVRPHEQRFGRAEGFYPPELAYSHHVAEVVADLGYRWILVDERARLRITEPADTDCHFIDGIKDLAVFFCRLPPSWDRTAEGYVVSCWQVAQTALPTCFVSQLFRLFPTRELARPLPSSAGVSASDLIEGVPYPRFCDPKSELHRALWRLARMALATSPDDACAGLDASAWSAVVDRDPDTVISHADRLSAAARTEEARALRDHIAALAGKLHREAV